MSKGQKQEAPRSNLVKEHDKVSPSSVGIVSLGGMFH